MNIRKDTLILQFRLFLIFLRNFGTKVYLRRKNEVEKPILYYRYGVLRKLFSRSFRQIIIWIIINSYWDLTFVNTMSSKRTTHRSCRSQLPFNVLLPVLISNFTCLSLGIPPQLACGVCSPRMDITTYSRKRKQKRHHLSERHECQKYWDGKWLSHICQSNEKLKSIEMHDNIWIIIIIIP